MIHKNAKVMCVSNAHGLIDHDVSCEIAIVFVNHALFVLSLFWSFKLNFLDTWGHVLNFKNCIRTSLISNRMRDIRFKTKTLLEIVLESPTLRTCSWLFVWSSSWLVRRCKYKSLCKRIGIITVLNNKYSRNNSDALEVQGLVTFEVINKDHYILSQNKKQR